MARKKILKELFVLFAIAFVSMLYQLFFVQIIEGNTALDINLHDTYYLVKPINSSWIIIPGFSFAIYLVRAIYSDFNDSLILFILGLSCLFILGWLNHIYQIHFLSDFLVSRNRISPINSVLPNYQFYAFTFRSYPYFNLIIALQVLLVLFIGIIGFLIGRNLNQNNPAITKS